jgi:hypothetical protein
MDFAREPPCRQSSQDTTGKPSDQQRGNSMMSQAGYSEGDKCTVDGARRHHQSETEQA